MIVNLDRGYIEAGVELTSVKSIIEEFKESEEMYQTRLSENWRAESIMADKKRHLSLIKMQISPGL
jgi:hypothetical protein